MENLPCDIIENILSRLPVETVLHARNVCTTWKAILRDSISDKPGFLFLFASSQSSMEMNTFPRSFGYQREQPGTQELFYGDQYDRTKTNYYNTLAKIRHGRFSTDASPRTVVVGSCNGLVCLGPFGCVPFLICNPLTGESVRCSEFKKKIVSEFDYSQEISIISLPCCLASGFGYCPSTNEYKVVAIFSMGEQKGHARVYTVGSGWRCIEVNSLPAGSSPFHYAPGIYANGSLYWLHQDFKAHECEIVAFDLEGEKFSSIPLPHSIDFDEYITTYCRRPLQLLGGNNNMYLVHQNYTDSRTDIWVYEKYNMHTGTSFRPMAIRRSNELVCYKFMAITRSNEVLLCYRTNGKNRLCCYDLTTSTFNKLWDDKANNGKCPYIEAVPHRQSIVSLKDLGETNVISLKDLGESNVISLKDHDQATNSIYRVKTFLGKTIRIFLRKYVFNPLKQLTRQ